MRIDVCVDGVVRWCAVECSLLCLRVVVHDGVCVVVCEWVWQCV